MAQISWSSLPKLGPKGLVARGNLWPRNCRHSQVRSFLRPARASPITVYPSRLHHPLPKIARTSSVFMSTSNTRQQSSELSNKSNWDGPKGAICREMHEAGFEEWGFVIYRCTYGDDEAWNRYMKYFKAAIHDILVSSKYEFLEAYARWTVVEDEADLQAASKLLVRQRFVEWRNQHCVLRKEPEFWRVIPHMPEEATLRLPRFTYCLFVDQDCLDTVDAHAAAKDAGAEDFLVPCLVAGLIDGDFVDHSPIDKYVCPPIEGCTEEYVGWEYIMVKLIPEFYNDYHYEKFEASMDYRRPPLIAPGGVGSMRMGIGRGGYIPSK
ncbi:hypothetical protein PG990_012245 [Apiospora arundinis]